MMYQKRLVCCLLGLLGLSNAALAAQPYVPDSDAEIVAPLPRYAPSAVLDSSEQPIDPLLAAEKANQYLKLGRYSADPRFYGQAQAVLAHWWSKTDAPVPVRLARARILQHDHRYADALADLDVVLAADPRSTQARLTRAHVHLVLGRFAEAERDCHALLRHDPRLASLCLADVRSRRGQLASATQVLEQLALPSSGEETLGADGSVWQHWLLGIQADVATRSGQMQAAERYYADAMRLYPDDLATTTAWADLLLHAGRHAELLKRFGNESTSDVLLLRIAIAQRALRDATFQESRRRLANRFEIATARGEVGHEREHALFLLDVMDAPDKALAAAAANFEIQREPIDLLLLVRAAAAVNRPEAAAPVWAFVDIWGFEDVRLSHWRALLNGASSP